RDHCINGAGSHCLYLAAPNLGSATMIRPRMLIGAALLLDVLSCTGCKVGPDYRAPIADVPRAFGETKSPGEKEYSRLSPDKTVWIEWWTKFEDAQLNSLIDRALEANHELRIAAARVHQARAEEKMAESRLYPSISLGASALATRGSEAGFGVP